MSMFNEVLKHKSFSNVCGKFVKRIGKKYNNKITTSEYIIERFLDKNIEVGFSYINNIFTPFFKTANHHPNFDIVFNKYEYIAGYSAISYAKNTNNFGLICNTSPYIYNNIGSSLNYAHHHSIPLMLLSFYNKEHIVKLPKDMIKEYYFIKTNHTAHSVEKFPNLLEYMMMICELPRKGPVHLKICNTILNENIDLDDIIIEDKHLKSYSYTQIQLELKKEKKERKNYPDYIKHVDDDNLSLLQYFEKKYEECEKIEEKTNQKK